MGFKQPGYESRFTLIVCVCGSGFVPEQPFGWYDGQMRCMPALSDGLILPTVRVKIVDKVSGADLFLSPASPYKPGDLKVTNAANDSVRFFVDSVDEGKPFVVIPIPETNTIAIKLASLTSDTIRVVFARDSPVCCPQLRIKSITLDNVQQCSPCTFAQLITIKK